jgi:lipopolysaccharide biosynthesis glycosyltransferase
MSPTTIGISEEHPNTKAKYEQASESSRARTPQVSHCVVFACDEGYAMPLATAIRSLVEAYRGACTLEIYVLSDGIAEHTQEKVAHSLHGSTASIHWVPVDLAKYQKLSTLSYASKMTFARLEIPGLLPSSISRVLYLDADLLVLDGIEQIIHTDLHGNIVGAVVDGLDAQIKSKTAGLERLPHVGQYFNAGVLLIDLDRWREEQITERALQYLNENPSTPYADQDALNVVCDGRWKSLDQRWNFQNCRDTLIANTGLAARPGIVHFVMSAKPWNARVHNVNADVYDTFRARTGFARGRQEKYRDAMLRSWCGVKRFLKKSGIPQLLRRQPAAHA